MTEPEARAVIAAAMAYAAVHGTWSDAFAARFVAGDADASLAELELDSLSTMEICIAIEAHAGVEVVPERLLRFASLGEIARFMAGGRR